MALPAEHHEPSEQRRHSSALRKLGWMLKLPGPQGVGAELPSAHQLPLVQFAQAVDPSPDWKRPAGQRWHIAAPRSGACEPGEQAAASEAPAVHALPAGQAWHSTALRRPVALPNDPASQAVGEPEPTTQYEPTGHSTGSVVLLAQILPAGQTPLQPGPLCA